MKSLLVTATAIVLAVLLLGPTACALVDKYVVQPAIDENSPLIEDEQP